jgi:hypothetical protein
VLPVERGLGVGASSFLGGSRRVEPETKVVHLHRIGLDAASCLWNECGRVGKFIRRRRLRCDLHHPPAAVVVRDRPPLGTATSTR